MIVSTAHAIPRASPSLPSSAARITAPYAMAMQFIAEPGTPRPMHNFSFTSEVRYWFKFDATKSYTLDFTGDDDVWVFVNKKLAVDLGGIHTPQQGVVTLNATTAQKQNLGRTQIHGLQMDAEYLLGRDWRVAGGYIFNIAKVTDGGVTNAALVGKYLAQVPKHRGSAQILYDNAKIANVSLAFQFVGLQYNDDQNVQFIPSATLADAGYDDPVPAGLPGYTSVDFNASRELGKGPA